MTTMLPDLDELVLEEFAVPCETTWKDREGEHRCDQDADWVVRTTCHCGHVEVDLLCDEHYQLMQGIASGEPSWFWRFICTACNCRNRIADRHAEPL